MITQFPIDQKSPGLSPDLMSFETCYSFSICVHGLTAAQPIAARTVAIRA